MANLKNTTINDTGFFRLASGGGDQRPSNLLNSQTRFNSDINLPEFYENSVWQKSNEKIPKIPTNGLVLYVDAGRASSYSGGNTWQDLSGNNLDGTLINSPSYTDSYGGALQFNGTNQSVNFGNNSAFDIASEITLSVFARGRGTLFVKGGEPESYSVISDNNEVEFYREEGNGANRYLRNSRYMIDHEKWNHIVAIDDGEFLKIYINGELRGNLYNSQGWTAGIDGSDVTLGAEGPSNSAAGAFGYTFWSGEIASAQIYNRSLTKTEIRDIFESHKERFAISFEDLGATPETAASSASAILEANPNAANGVYWIDLPQVGPTQVYCDMEHSDAVHGRGWMLAGAVDPSSSYFGQISPNWQNTLTTGSTASINQNQNMKNNVWNYYPHDVTAMSYQNGNPNERNFFTFTHRLGINLNQIFSWDNVNRGFIEFDEFEKNEITNNSHPDDFIYKIGFNPRDSNDASYGAVGLNVGMRNRQAIRTNPSDMTDGDNGAVVRMGYLGDNSSSSLGLWPGLGGGPDDHALGLGSSSCQDGGGCANVEITAIAGFVDGFPYNTTSTNPHIWVK